MDNYKKLLEAIEQYKKTKFWEIISGDDIFKLEAEDTVYISVLGNAGNTLGLVIYQDEEELYSQIDISFGVYEQSPDAPFRISCFELCIDDCGNLKSKETEKILKKNKIKSPHGVFKLKQENLPRLVNEEESKMLERIVNHVTQISEYFKQNEISLPQTTDLEEMYAFKIEQGQITHQKIKFPERPKPKKIETTLDEKLLNKLRLLSKKETIINIALMCSPVYIKEDEGYYPYLLIMHDEEKDMMLGCELIKPSELKEVPNKILKILANLKIYPEEIYTNDYQTQSILENITQELEIEISVDQEMFPIFYMWEQMSAMLIRGPF